jgi:hypothetical protein
MLSRHLSGTRVRAGSAVPLARPPQPGKADVGSALSGNRLGLYDRMTASGEQ